MTDDDIRALWRSAGGDFHGPNVETGTMPEAKLLPLLCELEALRQMERVARSALSVVQFASARQGHTGSYATIYANLHARLSDIDRTRLPAGASPLLPEKEALREAVDDVLDAYRRRFEATPGRLVGPIDQEIEALIAIRRKA